ALLSELHAAMPEIASRLAGHHGPERFLRDLDQPLEARVERFRTLSLRGEGLEKSWLEQDLVTTLNTLAQLLSYVIEARHRGQGGNREVEEELQLWLYERLSPLCAEEGWFALEEILPYKTKFDPRIHRAVETRALDGADDLVIGIKSIGRRD